MGGNALKSIPTRRVDAREYHAMVPEVLDLVTKVLGAERKVAVIEAYRTKESFGDMDILVETDGIRGDYKDALAKVFSSREVQRNGSVTSMDHRDFQIDIIGTPTGEFGYAKNYFAWNDLGNLIGRVAASLGFKHGHDGLHLPLVSDNQKFAEVTLTLDFDQALTFLDYDPQRFHQGFDTLEEVFVYASSSKYFHPWYYNLKNRSAYSRNRDSKRKTYLDFLAWVSAHPEFSKITDDPRDTELEQRVAQMHVLNQLPGARADVEACYTVLLARRKAHHKLNGLQVSALTGLRAEALGKFMAAFKHHHDGELKLLAWVSASSKTIVDRAVLDFFHNHFKNQA